MESIANRDFGLNQNEKEIKRDFQKYREDLPAFQSKLEEGMSKEGAKEATDERQIQLDMMEKDMDCALCLGKEEAHALSFLCTICFSRKGFDDRV